VLGHGNFFSDIGHALSQAWKAVKPFVGTVVGIVATIVLAPALGPWAAVVGSAIGGLTDVALGNATWKQAALGFAVGSIVGGALAPYMKALGPVLSGAIMGGTTGGILAGINGQNVGAGILTGAVLGGAAGGLAWGIERSGLGNALRNSAFGQYVSNAASGAYGAVRGWFSTNVPEGYVKVGTPYVVGDSPVGGQLVRPPAQYGGNNPEVIPNSAYGLMRDASGRLHAISPRNGRTTLIPENAVSDFTRLRPAEIDTMIRLRQMGIDVTESSHVGAEYVDSAGQSYDQMGNPQSAKFWNEANFLDAIDSHLLKSNNFTAIDLTGFAPEQQAAVSSYLNSLPAAQQGKIIKVGF
jgi:hypothetical protein